MEIVGAESDYVSEVARAWRPIVSKRQIRGEMELEGLDARAAISTAFNELPLAVQRRVLQMQLVELGVAADFELIESLRRNPGRFCERRRKMSVSREKSGEIKLRTESEPAFQADEQAVDLPGRAGRMKFGGKRFRWGIQRLSCPHAG